MSKRRATTLAIDHWDWLEPLLLMLDEKPANIGAMEYLYKTAFIHGYKHGQEDSKNGEETHDDKEEIPNGEDPTAEDTSDSDRRRIEAVSQAGVPYDKLLNGS